MAQVSSRLMFLHWPKLLSESSCNVTKPAAANTFDCASANACSRLTSAVQHDAQTHVLVCLSVHKLPLNVPVWRWMESVS